MLVDQHTDQKFVLLYFSSFAPRSAELNFTSPQNDPQPNLLGSHLFVFLTRAAMVHTASGTSNLRERMLPGRRQQISLRVLPLPRSLRIRSSSSQSHPGRNVATRRRDEDFEFPIIRGCELSALRSTLSVSLLLTGHMESIFPNLSSMSCRHVNHPISSHLISHTALAMTKKVPKSRLVISSKCRRTGPIYLGRRGKTTTPRKTEVHPVPFQVSRPIVNNSR